MRLLKVGLTGGLASGKSTVGRWLREGGCQVIDADLLVAELYRPQAAGSRIVAEMFGTEVLDPRGGVSHQRLAERVFADPEARRKLEQAIHPLVAERFQQQASRLEGIVVLEATLLVESGASEDFDLVVTVEAEPERRIERAMARGMDEASARARLAAQGSQERRRQRADIVLENDGTLEELRRDVEALLEHLHAKLRQRQSRLEG